MEWKFVRTHFFEQQLDTLAKKYPHIHGDRKEFERSFDGHVDADLGHALAKVRMKNSSIPTGKRGGYRIIVRIAMYDHIVIPLLIYAKTQKENVSRDDIASALRAVLKELGIE